MVMRFQSQGMGEHQTTDLGVMSDSRLPERESIESRDMRNWTKYALLAALLLPTPLAGWARYIPHPCKNGTWSVRVIGGKAKPC